MEHGSARFFWGGGGGSTRHSPTVFWGVGGWGWFNEPMLVICRGVGVNPTLHKKKSPNPASFFKNHYKLRKSIYVERLVYTFKWRTAVNGDVEVG